MATSLTALHGDSWRSPWFAVAIDGAATDLTQWYCRAQARRNTEDDTTVFTWTVAGGGLVIGTAEVALSSGATITTGAVQLRIRPADWAGKPRKWSGLIDVELSTDQTDSPAERHTVVSGRRFQITPDVAR